MANPRQRRKAKSSTHKAVSHSKRAKRLQKKMPAIRGPKALQDAWDRFKTLRQNYMALGLLHDLNPISPGGSEVNSSRAVDQTNQVQIDGARSTRAPPKGFGRIIRDASGTVVRVELPNDESTNDVPITLTKSELQMWVSDHAESRKGSDGRIVIQDLENLAASACVRERHTSFGERSYLERLVKKYGDDLGRMARDRRLNPEQRTANELRRAIAKAGVQCQSTVMEVTG